MNINWVTLAIFYAYAVCLSIIAVVLKAINQPLKFFPAMLLMLGLLFLMGMALSSSSFHAVDFFGGAATAFCMVILFLIIPIGLSLAFVLYALECGAYSFVTAIFQGDLNKIKPKQSYDLAEKAEIEKDFDKAISIYRQHYLAQEPDNPEPYKRIGEILVKQGKYEEALAEFNKAVELSKEEEQIVIITFRTADILAQKLNRPQQAKEVLEKLKEKIKQEKLLTLINERIKMVCYD